MRLPVSSRNTSSSVGRAQREVAQRHTSVSASATATGPIVAAPLRDADDELVVPRASTASTPATAPDGRRPPRRVAVDADDDHVLADAALELVRRALGDQPAVVDDADPVGQLVGLLEVLRGEEDRHAELAR